MRAVQVEALQGGPAFLERPVEQADAVEPQDVEDHQHDRAGGREPLGPSAVLHVHPLGQRAEGRPAVDHRDHLAVEQRVREEVAEGRELGKGHGDVGLAARGHPHLAVVGVEKDPHAVPLHLVQPLGAAGDAGDAASSLPSGVALASMGRMGPSCRVGLMCDRVKRDGLNFPDG